MTEQASNRLLEARSIERAFLLRFETVTNTKPKDVWVCPMTIWCVGGRAEAEDGDYGGQDEGDEKVRESEPGFQEG